MTEKVFLYCKAPNCSFRTDRISAYKGKLCPVCGSPFYFKTVESDQSQKDRGLPDRFYGSQEKRVAVKVPAAKVVK